MPTYQYRCSDCGNELEAVQKFTDAALTECPTCDGSLRKVFNAVGVVFKGSGFYRTDSRADKKSGGSGGASKSDKSDSGTEKKASTSEKKSDGSGSKQPVTAGSSSGSSSSGGSSSTAA